MARGRYQLPVAFVLAIEGFKVKLQIDFMPKINKQKLAETHQQWEIIHLRLTFTLILFIVYQELRYFCQFI